MWTTLKCLILLYYYLFVGFIVTTFKLQFKRFIIFGGDFVVIAILKVNEMEVEKVNRFQFDFTGGMNE